MGKKMLKRSLPASIKQYNPHFWETGTRNYISRSLIPTCFITGDLVGGHHAAPSLYKHNVSDQALLWVGDRPLLYKTKSPSGSQPNEAKGWLYRKQDQASLWYTPDHNQITNSWLKIVATYQTYQKTASQRNFNKIMSYCQTHPVCRPGGKLKTHAGVTRPCKC